MKNITSDDTARRYRAQVSILGTTQIHLRNPYIVAWWSAAFPGFGHLLLSKYLRGYVLFIWEVVINLKAHVNLGMIYSFQGRIGEAKAILDTRWLLIYIPVYLFAIWDSYRTTIDMNKIYYLADKENHRYSTFDMGSLEINYMDKRKPFLSVIWSMFMPGLGQLYIHRIATAFFIIVWTVVFFFQSHELEAIQLLFMGDVAGSTKVLDEEWLLFFPSIYGFSIFDSYMNTVENNKLFKQEQKQFLKDNYQNKHFVVKKGSILE
ncbi:hypothetical protein [Falsibacillus pallidus]|uniref:hypothetical protein n=1 Tax=Falsibacillus pallidus TaxID=493781 RepID=UPI003D9644CD